MVCLCDSKSAHHDGVTTTSSGKRVNSDFFWGIDRRGTWVNYKMLGGGIGGPVNLNQIVTIAYSLCNYIWSSYEKLSLSIELLIMYRLQPKSNDEGDGTAAVQEVLEDSADGEAYLERMYLMLRDQGMVSANECVLSGSFGCRQQCLYGCVCFCMLLIAMYHGDRANMSLVDWVNHVVLSGGCAKVVDVGELGLMEKVLLNSIAEVPSSKPIANCVFDLVNTKNPSGGMIGPGNCQWFHNVVLRLTRGVSEDMQKIFKNHAAIHDACGFMLTHTNVGAGYVFGLFPHDMISVSSAGACRSSIGHWLSSISALGQASGLVMTYYLMKRLQAPFLNTYDDQDQRKIV